MREPLTVRCREGIPVLFQRPARMRGAATLRESRWYRVRAVVASWSEATPWWRSLTASVHTSPGGSPSTPHGDRTIWRVEARPAHEPLEGALGGNGVKGQRGIGVFDLVKHPDGQWLLLRAHD